MSHEDIFNTILFKRGISSSEVDDFLVPTYDKFRHDPFLLPGMEAAVKRIKLARKKSEKIVIYGDYDIDGLTATTLLIDALGSFGFKSVDAFIPNRFKEGYGMTVEAVEQIAGMSANLIITVDCGSLSEEPIRRAAELGVDVIVTDHHNVAPVQPPAVAVINPKRLLADNPESYKDYMLVDSVEHTLYPFLDLPGVGVAFKLVQALQTKLDGLPIGQEKWLLDLVALGTVCDVVSLRDENRMHVYWGLKVLAKTRRPGLRSLAAVAGIDIKHIDEQHLGFALGPRMNAAGRLETAKYSQDLLLAPDKESAIELATKLDEFNSERRKEQDEIYKSALVQAERFLDDDVLVLSDTAWNHGIIGIVAAKILEKYQKPTFVLQEMGEESKGSARSYGDFSVADAIHAADDLIIRGGGHRLAAGVTLSTAKIDEFRKRVNEFYKLSGLELSSQRQSLLPMADVTVRVQDISTGLINELSKLKPFGNGNPSVALELRDLMVLKVQPIGSSGQHVKIIASDDRDDIELIAFSAPQEYFVDVGSIVSVIITPEINEWRGMKRVQGRILHLQPFIDE